MKYIYENLFSLDELEKVSKEILEVCGKNKKFYFYGEMGAGKTTLIKAICRQLKVEDVISSPTFSIVNEYMGTNGQTVYHFDFYRLKNLEEAFDLGYEDYLFSDNYCFIEWSEKVESILPEENKIKIYLKNINNQRNIKISI